MKSDAGRGLYVAGTDTGVGKTVLAAMLTLALDACYWKPVQSGLDGETDTMAVQRMTGLPAERFVPEAYRLAAPMSPDQSAERDGIRIDCLRLELPRRERPLVVEGAGGVMVPMNRETLQIDLIRQWGLPVVLAARTGLGTLNHTLLTIEALGTRGIPVLGVVTIGEPHHENARSLAAWMHVPLLGTVPPLASLDAVSLMEACRTALPSFNQWALEQR
ncbi:MAG TPA: dethiobiotin synthase [Candidatus Kapabacteria bacterium]|nr:dethiobiotin synthase [Candidatus Kapabacteria bacterium]